VLIGLLAVLLPGTPAAAHAELKGTNPAASSTVAVAIDTVTLTFSQPVKQPLTTVVVTGPDAVSYSEGAARSVDKDVLQAVRPLPVGLITVAWRTVSGDGHTIQGEFTFTNTAAPPAPSPTLTSASAAPAAISPTPAAASDQDSGTTTVVVVAIAGAAALGVIGGLLWWRRRRA
jgi:MYXO-CTERM domain-containing protein